MSKLKIIVYVLIPFQTKQSNSADYITFKEKKHEDNNLKCITYAESVQISVSVRLCYQTRTSAVV